MILDYLCFKNMFCFVLVKIFIYNFYYDYKFRNQVWAILISLLFIGFAWFLLWLYVLQRFKMIREFVKEIIF